MDLHNHSNRSHSSISIPYPSKDNHKTIDHFDIEFSSSQDSQVSMIHSNTKIDFLICKDTNKIVFQDMSLEFLAKEDYYNFLGKFDPNTSTAMACKHTNKTVLEDNYPEFP